VGVIVLAIAVDLAFGDPPSRWHPVAWMGGLLEWGRRHMGHGSPRVLLMRGAVLVLACGALAALVGWIMSGLTGRWGWGGVILESLALKAAFSLRDLALACNRVARALQGGDLGEARRLVGYHLVSRPTSNLDRGQVASAAIESAGENVTDAFMAPLVCYLALGLPGAYLYRTVNTADAMIGYRGGALEYFGKASARLDDALNLVPARLSALAIVVFAGFVGADVRGAWQIMWRDHGRTASPNAGWTMSAMAGALGVVLEKVGAYRLGEGRVPQGRDVEHSVRLILAAALGTMATALGWLLLRSYLG
jgi:adenosylcobinamide-phosphate synthase